MTAKVDGLDKLAAKLARLPQAIKQTQAEANDQNALEFMRQVSAIVPIGSDGKGAHLVSTLQKSPGTTPLSVKVSIGGPAAPYPAHLEFGHKTPGGSHVPAEPFWFPTLRVNKKRYRSRNTRAANKAFKALSAGPINV